MLLFHVDGGIERGKKPAQREERRKDKAEKIHTEIDPEAHQIGKAIDDCACLDVGIERKDDTACSQSYQHRQQVAQSLREIACQKDQ
ncbi:MAG: hypothetical protein DDT19_01179 [Syntrophomonadaceae bacterium]|nr:hypothetical protein [Bacillota bacterium]